MTTLLLPAPRRTNPHARIDTAVRVCAGLLLVVGLLLPAYWWIADGGIRDLSGSESGLTSLGRITGLASAVLLLAQVLLMARLPPLERAYGQDRLARIHRVVGLLSFELLVAHVVLITWGYAAGRLASTPATFWDLTWQYPGMLLAVAGTLALVLVVATSLRAARRRLRYESWHLLHLYAYLGVGLALPHQLWTGQQFLDRPGARIFWWTAWAAAAGAIVVFRLGVPLVQNLSLGLRVAGVVAEGPGVVSVHVTGRGLHRLAGHSGRFFIWRFLGLPGWSRAHPYSLSAAPGPHGLRITVQTVGDGSAALASLPPGSRVLVEGPFGRLSARARTCERIALIGAGVGLAPLRSLAEGLDYRPGEAIVLERFREAPLFAGEFDHLARTRGLRVVRLPGRRRGADSWVGTGYAAYDDVQVLLGCVPDIAARDVYVCGPPGWATSLVRAARTAGVPERQIHVEIFEW